MSKQDIWIKIFDLENTIKVERRVYAVEAARRHSERVNKPQEFFYKHQSVVDEIKKEISELHIQLQEFNEEGWWSRLKDAFTCN